MRASGEGLIGICLLLLFCQLPKSAGCDRQHDSTLKEDAWGMCGGEGKDCKTVKGDYDNQIPDGRTHLARYLGYKDIITILKGATNIHIQENRSTKNYFAVKNAFGKFYLNSQWKLTNHKKFMAAGTMFRYQKDSNGQLLIARGPTTHDLTVVLVGKGDSAKIHYEYYIPEKGHTSKSEKRQRKRRPKRKPVARRRAQPQVFE